MGYPADSSCGCPATGLLKGRLDGWVTGGCNEGWSERGGGAQAKGEAEVGGDGGGTYDDEA